MLAGEDEHPRQAGCQGGLFIGILRLSSINFKTKVKYNKMVYNKKTDKTKGCRGKPTMRNGNHRRHLKGIARQL